MVEKEKKAAEEKKAEGEGEGKKPKAAEKKAEGGSEPEKKEEKKDDEGKKDGKTAEGGGREGEGEKAEEAPPPPPPEEIVMRVYMHCEGCARKVQRSLAGFPGVEEVKADCSTHRVVVKGKEAAANPLRVVERLQRKSGRKAELLTPIPPKPKEEEKKEEEKEKPKPEEEKKEEPPVIAAVLRVRMHCDACSLEMKKRILKMKGVQSAEPDVKSSLVTVRGVFDPSALAEHVYRRTGRHAVVVKAEPVGKEEKAGGGGGGGGDGKKDKAAGGGGGGEPEKDKEGEGAAANDGDAAGKGGEVSKNPYFYHYPRYPVEYTYAPQLFSDENPNACSVM